MRNKSMDNCENLCLVYAEKLTQERNAKGFFEYEFFFSEAPDAVWAPDWNQQCPSACNTEYLRPDSADYSKVEKLYSTIPLVCIGDNSCFSGQDMIDGIVACVWEDISEYEEYPEPFRLVFKYGETYDSVESKLNQRHQFFCGEGLSMSSENENEG